MKASILGKIFSIILLLSFTQLMGGSGGYSYVNTEKDTKINTAIDNATGAYGEAKEMLSIMDELKGSDREKNDLYEQANILFKDLKVAYETTIEKAKNCKENLTTPYKIYGIEGSYTYGVRYNDDNIKNTQALSNNVLNIYQKIRVLHCKFLNPNDDSCKQIASYQQHMEKIYNNPQDTTQNSINDNVQSIINTINGSNSGGCTSVYNHMTHSYDCI